ncbi:SIS domain-containing protein [Daejeonella sp.]|uniref:SIS domain-containing protein n=1 Tax=Daejeonella sp. TaxID=2805397 RepID=UPI0030BA7766
MKEDYNHVTTFFSQVKLVADQIDKDQIELLARSLLNLREDGGRLFLLGVGGSAGNCSHAVNDFRKLCGIESYAPTDNVSELTARINDDGWDGALAAWLRTSNLKQNDAVLILSVGGGNLEKNVSVNLIRAIEYAKEKNSKVFGIVGRDGGFTKEVGDNVVVIPVVDEKLVTPHSEAFQAVVWHCLVSHPMLQIQATKW